MVNYVYTKKEANVMLSQFSFSNYKSFKNTAFLDMMAESIKDNMESVIVDTTDEERFLPVASIYGPNGGGKSTVLEALIFLKSFLLQQIILSDMQDEGDRFRARFISKISVSLKNKYHRFAEECKEIPTEFDLMFRTEENEFRYQLSMIETLIVEENLYVRALNSEEVDIIFERSEEECVLGEEIEGIAVERIRNTMPLLTHIAMNYEIPRVNDAITWFKNVKVVDYNSPLLDRQIIMLEEEKSKKQIFQILQSMDINIVDFRIEKDLDGNIEDIYAKHVLPNGNVVEILFEEESSGTKKLFSCLAEIIECLDKGHLMIADELDAKLHPKLLKSIVGLFTNPNTNKRGAQLLLTSHDITTMIPEVFRRDEIWFCAKNPENASKLYSLIAFRKENGLPPRNDEIYGKQYMEGRYGADPYVQRILEWGTVD